MKNLKQKIALLGMTLLIAGSASAAQTTAILESRLNVAPGCSFRDANYTANFGNIQPGKVGKAQVMFTMICTDGIPYSVSPVEDAVTWTGVEDVVITAYTTDARTTPITQAQPLAFLGGAGGFPTSTGNIYLRVNGDSTKPDLGEGHVLTEAQSISAVYTLQVNF